MRLLVVFRPTDSYFIKTVQKGVNMKRQRMSYSGSKKHFRRNSGTHGKNIAAANPRKMRGGIRLG